MTLDFIAPAERAYIKLPENHKIINGPSEQKLQVDMVSFPYGMCTVQYHNDVLFYVSHSLSSVKN